MATEARYGWELPDLGDVADAPAAFLQFANGVSATLAATGSSSYTPTWTTDGSLQPVNPATRSGTYQTFKGATMVNIAFTFGASAGGGNGAMRFGLPLPGRAGLLQFVPCRIFIPNTGSVFGVAEIRSGENTALPMFPLQATASGFNAIYGYFQNANDSAGNPPDTAVPRALDGLYPVRNGSAFNLSGSYLT